MVNDTLEQSDVVEITIHQMHFLKHYLNETLIVAAFLADQTMTSGR